jgi:hypothetical protein
VWVSQVTHTCTIHTLHYLSPMIGWDRMPRKDNKKMGNRETDEEKKEIRIEIDREKCRENDREVEME